jgi:hypothetical protein
MGRQPLCTFEALPYQTARHRQWRTGMPSHIPREGQKTGYSLITAPTGYPWTFSVTCRASLTSTQCLYTSMSVEGEC